MALTLVPDQLVVGTVVEYELRAEDFGCGSFVTSDGEVSRFLVKRNVRWPDHIEIGTVIEVKKLVKFNFPVFIQVLKQPTEVLHLNEDQEELVQQVINESQKMRVRLANMLNDLDETLSKLSRYGFRPTNAL